MVRPFRGGVNAARAWQRRRNNESAKLVKVDRALRSRKNDRKSFHNDAAVLLDKPKGGCETGRTILKKNREETMQIDRRQFALPALALGLLTALPAFAGADEDAILKNVETFRAGQAANKADPIAPLLADDLSYSHSSGAIDDKAKLLSGISTANYKWTTLEYKNPTVKVVGPAAIVRFNFVGEQEFADGKKTPQNLAILMNWQKQGSDWKLLSRSATKL
jgi:hypothetical protein